MLLPRPRLNTIFLVAFLEPFPESCLFHFSIFGCCGHQVPFPYIVPPRLRTSSTSPEVSQTPFRADPRYRPTSLCPPHHNHTRRQPARGAVTHLFQSDAFFILAFGCFQREGTFFGFDEAKRNFGNIVEGLRRSSDRMDVEDMLADEVFCRALVHPNSQ